VPVLGPPRGPVQDEPDAQLLPFDPYMGEPAQFGERLPPSDLRLRDTVDATSDSGGNLAIVFDPVPLGKGWWGTVSVPAAPFSATFKLYLNNQQIGQIAGPNPYGPLAVLGGERLSLTGTGLTVSTQFSGIFLGVMRETTDVDELVSAIVPQIQQIAGTVTALVPNPLPVSQSGLWVVGTQTTATPSTGQKVLAMSATQLSAAVLVPTNEIIVKALPRNAGAYVLVGESSGPLYPLVPNEGVPFSCPLNTLYGESLNGTDGVAWNVN
jgi:hypothetical protein